MRGAALGVVLFLAAVAGGATASTQGLYLSGLGGVSFLPALQLKTDAGSSFTGFDVGRTLGASVGYDDGTGWRYELGCAYQASNVHRFNGVPEDGRIRSMEVTANVLYDLTRGTAVTPYVGAGLGFRFVEAGVHSYAGNSWRPSYQLRTGLRYDLAANAALFLEYRFAESEAARLTAASSLATQQFASHAVMIGIIVRPGAEIKDYLARVASAFDTAPSGDDGDI